jgi:hypothetical protein
MNCKPFASAERSPEAAGQIGRFSVSRLRCPSWRKTWRSKQLPRCSKNTRSPPTELRKAKARMSRRSYAAVVGVCTLMAGTGWGFLECSYLLASSLSV